MTGPFRRKRGTRNYRVRGPRVKLKLLGRRRGYAAAAEKKERLQIFVGQFNYDTIMQAVFGETWMGDSPDRAMLACLDELPSLDPFLLREHLKRHDRHPARCYAAPCVRT